MYQLHHVCLRMVGGGVRCYRLVGKYIPTIIPYINLTRTTIPYKWFAQMNRWVQRQKRHTPCVWKNICMFWLNYEHAHSKKPQVYFKYDQNTWNIQCWFPPKNQLLLYTRYKHNICIYQQYISTTSMNHIHIHIY